MINLLQFILKQGSQFDELSPVAFTLVLSTIICPRLVAVTPPAIVQLKMEALPVNLWPIQIRAYG